MGITAHFYDVNSQQRRVVGLALRPLNDRHTGDYIFAIYLETLAEWGFEDKIFKIVTDNGSNVVKAFKDICEIEDERWVELDSSVDDNIEPTSLVDPNLDVEYEPDELSIEYAKYFSTSSRKRLSKFCSLAPVVVYISFSIY